MGKYETRPSNIAIHCALLQKITCILALYIGFGSFIGTGDTIYWTFISFSNGSDYHIV